MTKVCLYDQAGLLAVFEGEPKVAWRAAATEARKRARHDLQFAPRPASIPLVWRHAGFQCGPFTAVSFE